MALADVTPAESAARRAFGAIDRALGAVEWAVLLLAALTALFVMVLVSADALGRYIFNQPLIVTIDLVSRYLLPIIMLSAAGLVLRRAKHISVDLVASVMPRRLYHALLGFGLLVATPIVWIMCYRVLAQGIESFEAGTTSFGLVPWPLWPEQVIYGIAMGLLCLRILQIGVTNLAAAALGAPHLAIELANSHVEQVEEAV